MALMSYEWVSVEARTGVVIADLPDLIVDRVAVALGTYTTTTANLPVPSAPDDWERATLPMGACMVLLDDGAPVWGGLVTRRKRGDGDLVELSLATWEAYLDRRYVGDVVYDHAEQTSIVADLVDRFVDDGTVPLIVETVAGSQTRSREYKDASDKTVLSAMSELMGVLVGPEFTIRWRAISGPRFVPVLEIRNRIGSTVASGLGPAATFELPGSSVGAEYVEDWSSASAATSVVATSSANGDVRPQSPPQTMTHPDRPTLEYRFTPSTSITDIETLTDHAAAAVSVMQYGAQTLSMAAAVSAAPRLGIDWGIGDDVGYEVTAPSVSLGLSGVARCIGWELSLTEPQTVTPILAKEGPF